MRESAEKASVFIRLREMVRLNLRGYGILRKICPGYLSLSAVWGAASALEPLAPLFFSAQVLNELAGARQLQRIWLYVALAVGTVFLLSALKALLILKIHPIEALFYARLYFYLGERYMQLDFDEVEKNETNERLSDLEAKINGNGLGIPRLFWDFPDLVQQAVTLCASILLLVGLFQVAPVYRQGFITSPWGTALLAVLLLLSVMLCFAIGVRQQAQEKIAFSENPKINTFFHFFGRYTRPDQAGKDIRLYHQQPAIQALLDEWLNGRMWQRYFQITGQNQGLRGLVNGLLSGAVYLIIGLRALAGMYGMGSVLQYVGAVTSLAGTLTELVSRITSIATNTRYLRECYQYLDLPDHKRAGSLTVEKRVDNEYEIAFEHVSFRYPGASEDALHDLSLSFRVGKRLAVVGMNGSGKTTMIKLLCRLYDPTEGRITLNGIDIRKYDYEEYLAIFSVVFQDFQLLPLPLKQNVAASLQACGRQAALCLEKAGFGDRLASLPRGLDTCLGQDYDPEGVTFSGGETQKIALARALYKNAPFMVLDEPTAALDPVAEYEIYTRIHEIVGDKTAIFISHRLSSCRFCDDIAVFHQGRLVQRGSHEALLRQADGKYRELWEAQAQYYVASFG